jgi:hypothetical protein
MTSGFDCLGPVHVPIDIYDRITFVVLCIFFWITQREFGEVGYYKRR